MDGVAVANDGTIEIGTAGANDPTLLLDGGTTVSNGAITVGSVGTLQIGEGGATFDHVTVDNNNMLTIDGGFTLTLDYYDVINNGNLVIGTLGVLEVEQGPGGLSEGTPHATLDGVAVANGGNIEIGTAGTRWIRSCCWTTAPLLATARSLSDPGRNTSGSARVVRH